MLYGRSVSISYIQRLICVLLLLDTCIANTEKIIFTPSTTTFADLDLPIIQPLPKIGRLVYNLSTPFGDITHQSFRLDGLQKDQKYEVRICWPAIMPTKFQMSVIAPEEHAENIHVSERDTSQMILHIAAEPDFISPRPSVSPPAVIFEIILDPLILGFIPSSLCGIIYLIAITAASSYFLISPLVLKILEQTIRGKRQKIVRIKT